jgi:hypothetical protein
MNRLQPIGVSLALMAGFMLALVGALIYFIAGMGHSTYLVSDGVHVAVRYLDKPRYDMHLQGVIFTVSFLLAGGLLLLLALLPERERRAVMLDEAPQPARRPAGPGAAPQPAQATAAAPAAQAAAQPAQASQAAQAAPASQASQAAPQTSPLSIESGEVIEEPAPPPAEPKAERAGVSVEEEVLRTAGREDDLPSVDFGESRFEDTGDEDVVYGSGRVNEDSMWDFVQQYPDSAVKFLYRKTLDNKPLSPTEEDIYRNWEMRGMTRARIRQIVLDLMRWQSLPDNFPHEIWRELRDQIYELKAR